MAEFPEEVLKHSEALKAAYREASAKLEDPDLVLVFNVEKGVLVILRRDQAQKSDVFQERIRTRLAATAQSQLGMPVEVVFWVIALLSSSRVLLGTMAFKRLSPGGTA